VKKPKDFKPREPKNPLSEEDKDLWQNETHSIKKITNNIHEDHQIYVPVHVRPKPLTSTFLDTPFESRHYEPQPLEPKVFKKLQKGQFEIEGTLDLHGHTVDQAYGRFQNFINRSFTMHKRCVLIVTGKAQNAPDLSKTIKHNVKKWLEQSEIKIKILSYTEARPIHGGSGAFYVLLRRIR
jgi:DNA-nicking Smr family endonuclease